jgi:hypothetical protein
MISHRDYMLATDCLCAEIGNADARKRSGKNKILEKMDKFKELSFEEMQELDGGWLKEIVTAGFAYGVYLYDNMDRFVEGVKKGYNLNSK